MRITLEMVDEIIGRTGVSYKVAKDALELNDGDVLRAIVYIEEQSESKTSKKVSGQEIVDRLKTLVNEGMVSQIIIEKNNKTVLDLPIVAGAISAVIFTIPTVAGIIAAIATGCEIKIVKKDGDEININELTQDKFDEFVGKINKEKKESKNTSQDDENEDEEDFFVDEDETLK